MNPTRIALSATLAALSFWAAKAVAIVIAGGLDKSPLESPLFFAGLLSFVVASISLGVAFTRGRPVWLRALTGLVAAPVVGVASAMVVDRLVAVLQQPGPERHWVWTEFNLWVVGLIALALTLLVQRRDTA